MLLLTGEEEKKKSLSEILDRFVFLIEVYSMSDMNYFREKADYVLQHYNCDLETDFTVKVIVFFEILKMDKLQVRKYSGVYVKVYYCKKINCWFPKRKHSIWFYSFLR